MEAKPINVLVVEDSAVTRQFIAGLLQSDPALRVMGAVSSGEAALEFLQNRKPDVITMDINLPQMDGFEATRQIMETVPTPVVIVTATTNPKEVATTFKSVEAGALAVLPIPAGIGHPDHSTTARELIRTVKSMAEVRVVRRWSRTKMPRSIAPIAPRAPRTPPNGIRIVAIGASTGGPLVLQTILSALPADFPVPVVIVQHIAAGFVAGFAQWLAGSASIPVCVAEQRMALRPGTVYIAPDNFQMLVDDDGIILRKDPPENGLRPSVSSLFRSVAKVYGKGAAGVLLTGMGRDGAQELMQIKDAGGVTIAQSEESCVISGMPGEAIRRGAAMHILPPEKITYLLTGLVRHDAQNTQR